MITIILGLIYLIGVPIMAIIACRVNTTIADMADSHNVIDKTVMAALVAGSLLWPLLVVGLIIAMILDLIRLAWSKLR